MARGRHRVIAAGTPGVAATETMGGKEAALEGAVLGHAEHEGS